MSSKPPVDDAERDMNLKFCDVVCLTLFVLQGNNHVIAVDHGSSWEAGLNMKIIPCKKTLTSLQIMDLNVKINPWEAGLNMKIIPCKKTLTSLQIMDLNVKINPWEAGLNMKIIPCKKTLTSLQIMDPNVKINPWEAGLNMKIIPCNETLTSLHQIMDLNVKINS